MNKREQLLKVLSEYNRLGIRDQIDYEKFYLYSLITHSTAIEGSTVTEVENRLLFDEGIVVKGRSMQEQLMNLDLKKAYEASVCMAREHVPFSVEYLKGLSAIVMKNTGIAYNTILGSFDASKGDLRLVNVSAGIGGSSYIDFRKVPARLEYFCAWLNEQRVKCNSVIDQYALSFEAHLRLVTIHPWVDGNGRMSRLVMNQLQFEFGLVPSKIVKDDKAEYIQALNAPRETESPEPFNDFMFTEHVKNLTGDIEQYKRSIGRQEIIIVDRKGGQKTREAILKMIKSNPRITSTELANQLGINRSAISKHIKKLKDAGFLLRVGPDKGGHWEVL